VRVGFLTSEVFLGGGETSLLNTACELPQLGWEPVLFCPEGALARAGARHGVAVEVVQLPDAHLRAGLLPTLSLGTVLRLASALHRRQVHLVHAESLLGFVYGSIAAALHGCPCVASYHGYWPLANWALGRLLRVLCRRIFPVSQTVAQELVPLGLSTRVIPLDFSRDFLQGGADRQAVRASLHLAGRVVMQVARFQRVKGQLLLLEAAERLLADPNSADVTFVLVGGVDRTSEECEQYHAEVQARARSGRLKNRVVLLGPRDDIPALMQAADVIVCPSDFETFGMAVIEAQAAGVPVVARDRGAVSESVKDRETGRLVGSADPGELAQAIREFLADPAWAGQVAQRARMRALEMYRPGMRAERLADEYGRLVFLGRAARRGVLSAGSLEHAPILSGEGR
jgi:glycosyltransferase involved in cell wall biosynthesis